MMEQLPLRMQLRESARLANFVVGSNAQAYAALQGSRPAAAPVVWLWGRAGTGKSHLLQAACAAAGGRDLGDDISGLESGLRGRSVGRDVLTAHARGIAGGRRRRLLP